MSRLNIDGWTITSDSRFATLARLYPYDPESGGGFVDRDHARGVLERAWYECLMRQVPGLSKIELLACIQQPEHLFEHLFDSLLNSELADVQCDVKSDEICDDCFVIFRGTAERIGWLADIRKKRVKAGKASGIARRKKRTGVRTRVQKKVEQKTNLNAPALALAPALAPEGVAAALPKTKKQTATELWDLQNDLRCEAIPNSRKLKATKSNLARVSKILEDYDADDCRAVLEAYAGEVRKNPESAKWFDGVTHWRPENFARALGKIGTDAKAQPRQLPGRMVNFDELYSPDSEEKMREIPKAFRGDEAEIAVIAAVLALARRCSIR